MQNWTKYHKVTPGTSWASVDLSFTDVDGNRFIPTQLIIVNSATKTVLLQPLSDADLTDFVTNPTYYEGRPFPPIASADQNSIIDDRGMREVRYKLVASGSGDIHIAATKFVARATSAVVDNTGSQPS